MAEKKFTLFEVHLGDGHIQIGPKTIEHGDHDEADLEHEDGDGSESSSGSKLLPFVLLALVVGGVAFAASRFPATT